MFTKLQEKNVKKNVTIFFKNENIEGTNIGPGESIFKINEKKYFVNISTEGYLQYINMDSLSTTQDLPSQYNAWYRIHGLYDFEERDPISLSFKKIDKDSNGCAQRIATIKKI